MSAVFNVIGLDSDPSVVKVNSSMFDIVPDPLVVKLVIDWQLAKRRSGCHSSKTIGEVSGTGAKPYKQKRTGRARHGTLRGPQFRGGAVIFGPHYRDHGNRKVNSKVRLLALRMAIADKRCSDDLIVVDKFIAKCHKTKVVKAVLDSCINSSRGPILCVYGSSELDTSFRLGLRNLPDVIVLPVYGLNVYDVIRSRKVLIDVAGLDALKARFGFSEVCDV